MKGTRLSLDLFKVFRDLAETRSFTRAAGRNFLTQSAVSQQLAFLERALGRKLVDRGRGEFALTEAGHALVEGSRKILEAYQETLDRLGRPGKLAGSIKVETIYSIGLHELALLTKTFMSRHPAVEPRIEYRRSDQIYEDVLRGECDLGIVAYPRAHPRLATVPFRRERLVLACPPGSALAGRRGVRLSQLDGRDFVAFSRGIPTRRAVDRYLRAAKARVNIVHEFDNIETIKRAVEIGAGLAIVPQETIAREVALRAIARVALTPDRFYRTTGIIHRRDRTLSRACREFIRWLSSKA